MEELPVVHYLVMVYLNERGTKEVLPYNNDLVERVLFLLERQKSILKRVESGNRPVQHIYKMEIERVEWLLSEYLILRLEKIRENMLNLENTRNLSDNEKTYLKEYVELKKEQEIWISAEDVPERLKHPSKVEYAGFFVFEAIPEVVISGDYFSFSSGDFIITDISSIYNLIEDSSVLIV